jgi:hypothetical protein
MSEHEDLIRRHREAIASGDAEMLRGLLRDDCELVVSAGFVVKGPDQFIQVVLSQGEAFKEAFSDFRYDILDMVHTADTIVLENEVRGTHTGTLRLGTVEIPATYRDVTLKGCDYVKVENGLVKTWHAYADTMAFLTQLGIISPQTDVNTVLGLPPS